MKRLIPLLLALVLLLTACGTPSPSPTPYPASPQDLNTLPEPTVDPRIPQEPAVLAGPADEGYTFTSDTQHFSIEIPDEAAPYVVICDGLTGYYPVGEAVSFCFYSYKYDTILGTFGTVIAYPREDFFDPTTIYNESSHAVCDVIKASEDYIYVHLGSVGGSDMPIEPLEGLDIAGDTIGFNALRENMVTLPADDMPALERDSLPAAAAGLNALGDAVMTRGDAAVFVTDILTADNKDRAYPLRFTDVAPGTDEAHSIAYLDSYGVFARYTRGGDLIPDGDLFRPDEPITRAEFVQLLQRVQFARSQISHYPISFGDSIPASDLDKGHFAYLELDRAWKDGWIELTDGLVRPDEAMTAAEMREALTALYRELVREDMSMPVADLEYNHYCLSGDVDDAVTAVVIIDEGGEKFRCWYGYERDGVIFCGILDESCAVLSQDGIGSPYVIETDEPELRFELTTTLSDIACWQNIPFIYEPGQYAETNSLRGVVPGMGADEVVARFPAYELYSCLSDGYIYGAEGGACGIIGTDAGGRYIQYSDGENSVRFSLNENDCVKVIEYIPG